MTDTITPENDTPVPGNESQSSAPKERLALKGWVSALTLCAISIFADQATKQWAHTSLRSQPGSQWVISSDYFSLRVVHNRGAAWGFLAQADESFRKPFFYAVSALAILLILHFLRRLRSEQHVLLVGFSLVLSGAIGNLIDRLRFGHVIDFISVHYKTYYTWPTFNIADIAISVGVALILLDSLVSHRRGRLEAPTTDSHAGGVS